MEHGLEACSCQQHQSGLFGLAFAGSTGRFIVNLDDPKSAPNKVVSLQDRQRNTTVKHPSLGNKMLEKSKMKPIDNYIESKGIFTEINRTVWGYLGFCLSDYYTNIHLK